MQAVCDSFAQKSMGLILNVKVLHRQNNNYYNPSGYLKVLPIFFIFNNNYFLLKLQISFSKLKKNSQMFC